MAQAMYEARFIPGSGGLPITVRVPANDAFQAQKIIESQYGPIQGWIDHPREVR